MKPFALIPRTAMLHDCGCVIDRFQWLVIEIKCGKHGTHTRPVGFIMMLKTLERTEPFAWSEEGPRMKPIDRLRRKYGRKG